jgi:hypothetical protein
MDVLKTTNTLMSRYDGYHLVGATAKNLRRLLKVIMAVVMVWSRLVVYHIQSLYKIYLSSS